MSRGLHAHYTRSTSLKMCIVQIHNLVQFIGKGRAQGQGGALDNWHFPLGFIMCIYRRTKLKWRKYITMFCTSTIVFIT